MVTKKKKTTNQSEEIISSIAAAALNGIEGIVSLSSADKAHFKVDIADEKAFIDVNINVGFGFNVPELAYAIQTQIKRDIEKHTIYTVEKVNVNILGVIMPL